MIATFSNIFSGIKVCFRLQPFDVTLPEGRAKERYRRVILASTASISAKIIAVVALLISTPLTLNYLGTEQFGLWMTISSLIAVLGFADLGIGNGLLNVIAEAHGRDDLEQAKRAVTSSVVLLTVIGLIMILVFAIGYPFINWGHLFNISDRQSATEAGKSTAVLIACLAISLPLMTVQRVQLGYQEGLQANLWQAGGSIFMLIGILLGVHKQASLSWLVLAAAGGPVVAMGLNWLHQFGIIRKYLLPRLSYFDWKMGRRIAALGALWTWFQLMAIVGTTADNIIVSHFFGAGAVGSYAIMSKLLSCLLIAQLFSAPLWPAFAEALERGDMDWVRKTFRRILILFSLFGVLSALVMGFGSFWIISVWVGPAMMPSLSMALGFALWGFITNLFAAIAALMANNRLIRQLTYLTSIAALSSFGLKFVLLKLFGVSGVIWATVLGYGLICVPGLLVTRRVLKSSGGSKNYEHSSVSSL